MVNDTARCDADEPWIYYVGIEGVSWMKERKRKKKNEEKRGGDGRMVAVWQFGMTAQRGRKI